MKLLFFTIIILLCSCSQYEQENEIVLPLYNKCSDILPEYISKLNSKGYGIEAKLIKFDKQYEAHPAIIGTLILSSKPERFNDLKVAINSIELNCFPKYGLTVDADELGLKIVEMEMKQRKNEIKETEFLRLKNGKFIYYYPGSAKIH